MQQPLVPTNFPSLADPWGGPRNEVFSGEGLCCRMESIENEQPARVGINNRQIYV